MIYPLCKVKRGPEGWHPHHLYRWYLERGSLGELDPYIVPSVLLLHIYKDASENIQLDRKEGETGEYSIKVKAIQVRTKVGITICIGPIMFREIEYHILKTRPINIISLHSMDDFHRFLKFFSPKPGQDLGISSITWGIISESYQISPSKNMLGIAFTISAGKIKGLPNREKNVFLSGFQNPRTPSYFSNTHLHRWQ